MPETWNMNRPNTRPRSRSTTAKRRGRTLSTKLKNVVSICAWQPSENGFQVMPGSWNEGLLVVWVPFWTRLHSGPNGALPPSMAVK